METLDNLLQIHGTLRNEIRAVRLQRFSRVIAPSDRNHSDASLVRSFHIAAFIANVDYFIFSDFPLLENPVELAGFSHQSRRRSDEMDIGQLVYRDETLNVLA